MIGWDVRVNKAYGDRNLGRGGDYTKLFVIGSDAVFRGTPV